MTTDPQRPEVDDPRVLALAAARQQRAHRNPFNAGFCPPWDGLTEQEQHLSLLDARNYLRAAIDAGLVASVPSAPVDRERIAAALYRHEWPRKQVWQQALAMDRETFLAQADAVLAVLPAPVDRAAVLAEMTARVEAMQGYPRLVLPEEIVAELRRMAAAPAVVSGADAETAQAEAACVCGHPMRLHHEDACLHTACGCADSLEISALPEALEAVLTKRHTELGNPFSEMRRREQGPDGWPASRPVGPHHVAGALRDLLRRAADDGSGLRLPDHAVNEEETPDAEHPDEPVAGARQDGAQRPAPRDRHRSAWSALTPQQQAAYLAQLDNDEEQQPETQAEEIALLRLTVDAVEEGRRELRAENARLRAQLWTLASMLDGLHTLIATSSRDWQTYRVDAWLWAVLCGWDCEQTEHTDTCTHGALEETAAMHGWDDAAVAKARRYRAAVRVITEAAAVAQPETVHACPPDGSGLTPCCGRTPFELPRTGRMSTDPAAVTCPAAVAQPGKEAQPIPCNAVHLRVHHAGHQWEPQPGMDRIPCAGYPAAAPQPEEA